LYHSDIFRDGAPRAVNLGGDADITGAVYGDIAGAHQGADSIPAFWLDRLAEHELITSPADRLYAPT